MTRINSVSQVETTQNNIRTVYIKSSEDELIPVSIYDNGTLATDNIGDSLIVNAAVKNQDEIPDAETVSETETSAGNLISGCSDDKDDGKIGVGAAIGNFLWGAAKSVGNTIKGIIEDPKKAITAAATTAVCVAFPPAAVGLGAIGAATGALSLTKSAFKAYNIYKNGGTDEDMKTAMQDAGASTLQIGLSIAGAKAGAKAMKNTAGSAMSKLETVKGEGFGGIVKNTANKVKAFAEDAATGGKGFTRSADGSITGLGDGSGYKATQIISEIKTNVQENGMAKGIQKTASDARISHKTAQLERKAQKQQNKYEKMSDESKAKFDDKMKKELDEAKAKVGDANSNLKAAETAKNKAENELTDKEMQNSTEYQKALKDFEKAESKVIKAKRNFDEVKNSQNAFNKAKVDTAKLKQDTLDAEKIKTGAKERLEDAQKAYEKIKSKEGGTEAELAVAKEAVTNTQKEYMAAQNSLNQLKAAQRLRSSSNSIYKVQKFTNTANEAGYSSGFGALTSPLAVQTALNSTSSNLEAETANYNTENANDTGDNYDFSIDYNTELNKVDNYKYNMDYSDLEAAGKQALGEIIFS